MTQVIIYNDENGEMRRIRPTDEGLSIFTIEQIAQKDVPAGRPYKIMNASELPPNWHEREAWEVSDTELNDGVGAEWSTIDEVQL